MSELAKIAAEAVCLAAHIDFAAHVAEDGGPLYIINPKIEKLAERLGELGVELPPLYLGSGFQL